MSSAHLLAADDPIEVEPSDDTWLSADYTGKAAKRGEHEEVQIYGKTDDTTNRALFKFDMKKVAPGFKSAILRLTAWNFAYSAPKATYLRCHALTSAWNEQSATWDIRSGTLKWIHPGGDWDPRPVSGYGFSGPVGGGGDRDLYFDLTNIVREWQAQPNKNEGVAIMLEKGCAAEIRVRTKEFATATARPKLMLYYQKAAQKNSAIIAAEHLVPYEPYDPAAPNVTLGSKPDTLKLNEAFESKYSASGAKEPYNFVAATPLVPGLNLTPDGTLKGKPSKAGAYIVGVTCVAGNGKKATEWERWVVIDPNAAPPKPPAAVADNKPKDPAKPDDKKPEEKEKPKPAAGPQEE